MIQQHKSHSGNDNLNQGCDSLDTQQPPTELRHAIEQIYAPAGYQLTGKPQRDPDLRGRAYSACCFGLNNMSIAFRVAKKNAR